MEYIEAGNLKLLVDSGSITILDVREPYEVDICSIGGLHIPMSQVAEHIEKLQELNKIVVLCRTGKRAEAVANMLMQDYELKNILVLQGGLQSWIDEVDNSLESY